MANPYYVEPAGDMSRGLQGLGQVLQHVGEKREEKALLEQKRAADAEAQAALYDALKSDNPEMVMEAAIKHPSISKQLSELYGFRENYQKKEASEFAAEVMANPERAGELAERRIALLEMQGRDPQHTIDFYQTYQQDPKEALRALETVWSGTDPESYKSYLSSLPEAVKGATDLGKLQQDLNSGLISQEQYQQAAKALESGGGSPEFGLTPLVYRNPETGEYIPYLPNKAGGMQQLPTPEGLQFTPDSGRLAFNPTNIQEQGVAQANTKLETAPVMGEAARQQALVESRAQRASALTTKEDQTALLNEVVGDIKGATGALTTGFMGDNLKGIPGTAASNMAANLDTLLAAAGFEKLQEMRNNSPTGGALGSVTERELALLQATWGSIQQSQSKEQFERNLDRFQKQVNDSWQRVDEAYQRDYGQSYFKGNQSAPSQGRRRFNPATGMIE